jgi:uncharacterized protein YdhG (YjbR/CyaY superfamily)
MRTNQITPQNIDEYIAGFPDEVREILQKIRTTIHKAAPGAEEKISYQIPTYKYHGPLVHFVARTSYCSFIAVSKTVLEKFKAELANFDTSGTTIHFTVENPLPAALVKKIVKARVAENEAQAKLKQK